MLSETESGKKLELKTGIEVGKRWIDTGVKIRKK